MLDKYADDLCKIDAVISSAKPSEIPALLNQIPIDVFGLLLLDVPEKYPNIKSFFPKMASEEIQRNWTGEAGEALLSQTLAFVSSMISAFTSLTRRELEHALVLDFGCGWGRIIRLMYKYVSFEKIYGVDPWDKSIEICKECGMKGHFGISEYVPTTLPFDHRFNLIYAFSVFTHLSEKTAGIVLKTLRKYIVEDGLLVITIRPKEYWHHHEGGKKAAEMIKRHNDSGFAFIPHNRPPIDGDITYGDTSMTLEHLERNSPGWKITMTHCNLVDRLQVIVFLQPK